MGLIKDIGFGLWGISLLFIVGLIIWAIVYVIIGVILSLIFGSNNIVYAISAILSLLLLVFVVLNDISKQK